MKFLVSVFLYICLILHADFAMAKTQLEQILQNTNILYAAFQQTKILPELDHPFTSNGEVYFQKDKGTIWNQQKPEDKKFSATPTTYCVDGQQKRTQNLPHFNEIRQLTDTLLTGNLSALDSLFKKEYSEFTDKTWHLKLVPIETQIANIIQDIRINGNAKMIKTIHVIYQNNTTLIIELTPISKEPPHEIDC